MISYIDKNIKLKFGYEFYPEEHQYFYNGKKLGGVTGIVTKYKNKVYPRNALPIRNAVKRGNIIHEYFARCIYDCINDTNTRNDRADIINQLDITLKDIKDNFYMIQTINSFVNENKELFKNDVLLMEHSLANSNFAGTPDLVLRAENGKAKLIDVKSWKNIDIEKNKSDLEKMESAQLQLTAYAELLNDNGIETTEKAEIWVFNEDGFTKFSFDINDLLKINWQDAKAYYFLEREDKNNE